MTARSSSGYPSPLVCQGRQNTFTNPVDDAFRHHWARTTTTDVQSARPLFNSRTLVLTQSADWRVAKTSAIDLSWVASKVCTAEIGGYRGDFG
jgi:hypothetical protein